MEKNKPAAGTAVAAGRQKLFKNEGKDQEVCLCCILEYKSGIIKFRF